MAPWSVAGLPFRTAWVCVGPPLLAGGPRPGTMTSDWSPGLLKAEVALPSPIRLKPLDKKELVGVPSTKSTSLLMLAEMTLERTSVRIKVSPKLATPLPSSERLAEGLVMVLCWVVVTCGCPPITLEVVLIRALASAGGVVGRVPSASCELVVTPAPDRRVASAQTEQEIVAAEAEDAVGFGGARERGALPGALALGSGFALYVPVPSHPRHAVARSSAAATTDSNNIVVRLTRSCSSLCSGGGRVPPRLGPLPAPVW